MFIFIFMFIFISIFIFIFTFIFICIFYISCMHVCMYVSMSLFPFFHFMSISFHIIYISMSFYFIPLQVDNAQQKSSGSKTDLQDQQRRFKASCVQVNLCPSILSESVWCWCCADAVRMLQMLGRRRHHRRVDLVQSDHFCPGLFLRSNSDGVSRSISSTAPSFAEGETTAFPWQVKTEWKQSENTWNMEHISVDGNGRLQWSLIYISDLSKLQARHNTLPNVTTCHNMSQHVTTCHNMSQHVTLGTSNTSHDVTWCRTRLHCFDLGLFLGRLCDLKFLKDANCAKSDRTEIYPNIIKHRNSII